MRSTVALFGLGLTFLVVTAAPTRAAVAYSQPPGTSGTLIQSSYWDPDDSDYDILVWDDFTLGTPGVLTEVRWRGGFIYGGTYGGPVVNFTVAVYASIAAGTQPDVVNPPLVSYETGGNAGQTYAGTVGGTAMYDYRFVLPSPFQAAANTRYWVYLVAWQHGIPEWGLCRGTGGNGNHFRYVRGLHMYQMAPGDAAFTLIASDATTYLVSAAVSPANTGAVQGAGLYPPNSVASLLALPDPGWAFDHWSENNAPVSANNPYTFTVTGNRDLVAHMVPQFTIATDSLPSYGGTASGGGTYKVGSLVTVQAVANAHFTFAGWTEFGVPVSTSPVYSFVAAADTTLTANFALDAAARVFDFENAPIHTSLPIDLTVGGLTAHLAATGYGFSTQPADTMGFTPAGFAGICLYPNSVFPADLVIDFPRPLTSFSIMYASQELACDTSATMRATGYRGGAFVATNTTTAPVPGTWPTGTLTLDAPAGFDRVVVHYDARPPTCQDWGPIFLADNMIVALPARAMPVKEARLAD